MKYELPSCITRGLGNIKKRQLGMLRSLITYHQKDVPIIMGTKTQEGIQKKNINITNDKFSPVSRIHTIGVARTGKQDREAGHVH